MTTLNEVLAVYGLRAHNDPTNQQFKRMIRHLLKEHSVPIEEPQLLGVKEEKRVIRLGKQKITSLIFKAMELLAGIGEINDPAKFSNHFGKLNGKKIQRFLTELIEFEFDSRIYSEIIEFETKDGVFFDLVVSEAIENKHHPMNRYFAEHTMKLMFKGDDVFKSSILLKLLYEEVDLLQNHITDKARLNPIKQDVIQFMYGLIQEIIEEQQTQTNKECVK